MDKSNSSLNIEGILIQSIIITIDFLLIFFIELNNEVIFVLLALILSCIIPLHSIFYKYFKIDFNKMKGIWLYDFNFIF